jgi:hypothetical protein
MIKYWNPSQKTIEAEKKKKKKGGEGTQGRRL